MVAIVLLSMGTSNSNSQRRRGEDPGIGMIARDRVIGRSEARWFTQIGRKAIGKTKTAASRSPDHARSRRSPDHGDSPIPGAKVPKSPADTTNVEVSKGIAVQTVLLIEHSKFLS